MKAATDFQQLMLIDSDFEKILTNPILDIAARFWDEERYNAFKVCYRSMREIDDLIDTRKAAGDKISNSEKNLLTGSINQLTGRIAESKNAELSGLYQTMAQFSIPEWPWERLAKSMIYDIDHNGFETFATFSRYAEGAAVSPAAVFVHLCGVKQSGGGFDPPDFDIRKNARALAVFSYLVHIMRDFEKDQLRNLNYFSDDILIGCGLNKNEVRKMAEDKLFDKRLSKLFAEYKKIAEYYQHRARITFETLLPQLAPKYQLSLQIIYALYSHLFEKVEPASGAFGETDLNLSPEEVEAKINLTVGSFRPV